MDRTVVVVPPFRDFYFTYQRWSSLGAHALRRELTARGLDAAFQDFPATGERERCEIPPELSYLKPFIIPRERGPLTYHRAYHRFGPSIDVCVQRIQELSPSVCFISCFAYCYVEDTEELAGALKEALPGLRIVVGGHAVSAFPERFVSKTVTPHHDHVLFDLVVAGEIEGKGNQLIDAIEDGRRRIVDFRRSKETRSAYPVFNSVGDVKSSRWFSVSLTRGCPAGCEFCSNALCHGTTYRCPDRNTMAKLIQEMEIHSVPQPHINIEDDNILLSPSVLSDFVDMALDCNSECTFSAENGLDYRLLSESHVVELKEKGFSHLNLSLAAGGSERDSKVLQRVVEAAGSCELPVTVHFICGVAHDTPSSIVDTIVFLHNLPVTIGISPFYQVPNLPGFDEAERITSASPRRMMGSAAWPWSGSLTTGQIVTAFRLSRWSNAYKAWKRGTTSPTDATVLQRCLDEGRIFTVVREKKHRRVIALDNLDRDMMVSFFEGIST